MNKNLKTRKLILYALLTALQIVFVRLLSFEAGSVRISLGYIPVAVAGMMLGPVGGGVVGAIADFMGMVLFSKGTVYFFPLTISEVLYGVGFGLMLGKNSLSPLKLSVFAALQFIFINLLLNSFWLYLYYEFVVGVGKGFGVILAGRLLAACVNLPTQLIGVNAINKYLKKPLGKIYGRCKA